MKKYQQNKLRRKVFAFNKQIEEMVWQTTPLLIFIVAIIIFYSL